MATAKQRRRTPSNKHFEKIFQEIPIGQSKQGSFAWHREKHREAQRETKGGHTEQDRVVREKEKNEMGGGFGEE